MTTTATSNNLETWFRVRDVNNATFEVSKRPNDVQIAISHNDGRTTYAYLNYDQYNALIVSERVNDPRDERIAELEAALRGARTQFYAHDCLNNVDCRKCKALDTIDRALNPSIELNLSDKETK